MALGPSLQDVGDDLVASNDRYDYDGARFYYFEDGVLYADIFGPDMKVRIDITISVVS